MKKATISQAKNRLSELLDAVRHGESVLITDRSRPVARIEPVGATTADEAAGWLDELERAGVVRRGRGDVSKLKLPGPIPRPKRAASVVDALLAEREESR
ncbi:MAG: type II toxin-antitoxin system prevent-host-death family antitoxin [Burkholderiales bacterium]|nr:type II toxin-antitoxin system prevent-host-death family antitoxin [Burkholderiales bacterium]